MNTDGIATRRRAARALLALGMCLPAMGAHAQADDAIELEPLVVVTSKSPRPLADVAGQVSVIDASDLRTHLIEDLDNLLRYQPGLDIETQGTRFGVNGFNIRGIGGNRVAVEIDGVPVRDAFTVGSYSSASRALLDTSRIKRVEVLHGPASTLYGSDALGGVLAITTWNPADLVARGSRGDAYLGIRAGATGADSSRFLSGQAALAGPRHGLLVSATVREGHERESNAVDDGALDPRDWDTGSYAGRWTWDAGPEDALTVSTERFERSARTEVRSLLGYGRFRSTTSLAGDDTEEREQLSLEWSFSRAWADSGVLRAFGVDSQTRQTTEEERAAAAVPVQLWRRFDYHSELWGAEANLFRTFVLGGSDHHLGMGLEYLESEYSELRNGRQTDLASGSVSDTILGETFPLRDFPNSTTTETGLFVQDEIHLAGGRWQLIPAIRFERFRLDPRPDAIYLEDNPSTAVVAVDERRINPRFGIVYRAGESLSAYAQYVEGFRAPPFEDVNIGLDIPLFNIRALPNPDLESETSRGIELGLRYTSGDTNWSLALFDTRFDEFIESRALVGVDPQTGTLLFQSRNIESARIYGADVRLSHSLARHAKALDGWTLTLAAYWSRGENRDNDQPLNGVSPPQAVLGLAWASHDGAWDAQLNATLTARQDDIDETAGARFSTPGYALLDFTAGWRMNERVHFRAALRNLTDETYWRWPDVANLAIDDPMIPLLARPGRNLSVSAHVDF